MASVVTEHVILLIPTFFAMMVFALVANAVVANYATQQQSIIITGAQNQLVTTISQLYFSITQSDIQGCTVTSTMPLPQQIDGQDYVVTGSLDGTLLTLNFYFPGKNLRDDAVVHLGPEVEWDPTSQISSTNTNSVIVFEKYYNAIVGDYRVKISFR